MDDSFRDLARPGRMTAIWALSSRVGGFRLLGQLTTPLRTFAGGDILSVWNTIRSMTDIHLLTTLGS